MMEKLAEMEGDLEKEGLTFDVRDLETLQPLGDNAQAARRGGLAAMRRLTMVAEHDIEAWLVGSFVERGATGFTTLPCSGARRYNLQEASASTAAGSRVRIEVVVPHATCKNFLGFLRQEVLPHHHVTACVETVDVVRRDHFDRKGSTIGIHG